MKFIFALMGILLITSCGQNMNTSGRSTAQNFNAATCSCTAQYSPVCGITDGKFVTYTNACVAQCNGADYTNGACQGNALSTNGQSCNLNSGNVCGRILNVCDASQGPCTQTNHQPRLFSNECELINSNAERLNISDCY